MLEDDPAAALQLLTTSMSACAPSTAVAVDAGILAPRAALAPRRDAQALRQLSTAIDLAAEPGIIAPFVTAAHSIEPLLERHRTLVAQHRDFTAAVRTGAPHAASMPVNGHDAHALTDWEKAILPYLATHLKATEIAAEFYLSANTIKTHQQSMYRKLGVANRREAVDRGSGLGLI